MNCCCNTQSSHICSDIIDKVKEKKILYFSFSLICSGLALMVSACVITFFSMEASFVASGIVQTFCFKVVASVALKLGIDLNIFLYILTGIGITLSAVGLGVCIGGLALKKHYYAEQTGLNS